MSEPTQAATVACNAYEDGDVTDVCRTCGHGEWQHGMSGLCPSVYPPSADAPHEGPGWSGPLRCVLSDNGHEDHWHHGIHWQQKRSGDAHE